MGPTRVYNYFKGGYHHPLKKIATRKNDYPKTRFVHTHKKTHTGDKKGGGGVLKRGRELGHLRGTWGGGKSVCAWF